MKTPLPKVEVVPLFSYNFILCNVVIAHRYSYGDFLRNGIRQEFLSDNGVNWFSIDRIEILEKTNVIVKNVFLKIG